MTSIGRPSIYSDKLAGGICERIADGDSLRKICLDDDMPCRATVRLWLISKEEFLSQYMRAEREQADNFAEEIIEIADDCEIQTERAKVKIDARKWRAARQAPKRWGDKQLHEHSGSVAIGSALDALPDA